MSDYLERLTNRLFGLERDLRPRERSRYEPDPGRTIFEPGVDEWEEQELVASTRRESQLPPAGGEQAQRMRTLEIHLKPPALLAKDENETQPAPSNAAVTLHFPEEHLFAPDIAPESSLPVQEPSPKVSRWQEPISGPNHSPRATTVPDLPTPRVKQPVPQPERFPHATRTHQLSSITEPASSASRENESQPIQITIGRVEVRLSHLPTTPPTRPSARRNEPKVSLDDYLKRCSGEKA